MAAGNKSSSSLVHPVSFFSPHDSFLISCVWSCMCTWHLLADVTPPCPSAHIMHILLEPKQSIRLHHNSVICASQGPGESSWPVCCCNWFLFSCTNEFFFFLFLWKLFIWKWCDVVTTLVELFSPLSKVATSRGNSLCCHLLFCWFCQQKLIGVHFNSPRALISVSGEIPRPN